MSNSALATYTLISPNRNSPRQRSIDRVTVHCFVGQVTAKRGCEVFQPKSKQASCNYVVGCDGSIGLCVEEKDRSWCSSSRENDNRAITIEVASETYEPYAVTYAAYDALLRLLTDICKRYGKTHLIWFGDKTQTLNYTPKPHEMVMTVHRWFANKSCPGTYLYNLHGQIAQEVTRRLNEGGNTLFKPYLVRVKIPDLYIRKGPGTNYDNNGFCPVGAYTIIGEAQGQGATKWGQLKSGAGWISLDYVEVI
jgi:hypothetical protein